MITTESARGLVREVWPAVVHDDLEDVSETIVLAVSRGETGYGESWAKLRVKRGGTPIDPEPLRFNMGAVQCPNVGADCSADAQRGRSCALAVDSKDGTKSTEFAQCFRAYDSALEGFADYVKELVIRRQPVRKVLASGDCSLVAKVMRENSYFSRLVPVRRYGWFIYSNAHEIEARLHKTPRAFLRPCLDCGALKNQRCIRDDCPGKFYERPKIEIFPPDKLPPLPLPTPRQGPTVGSSSAEEGNDDAFGIALLTGFLALLR